MLWYVVNIKNESDDFERGGLIVVTKLSKSHSFLVEISSKLVLFERSSKSLRVTKYQLERSS